MSLDVFYNQFTDVIAITSNGPDRDGRYHEVRVMTPQLGVLKDEPVKLIDAIKVAVAEAVDEALDRRDLARAQALYSVWQSTLERVYS